MGVKSKINFNTAKKIAIDTLKLDGYNTKIMLHQNPEHTG